MLMIVQILSILFMNGMATWAVNRQQRKSWGVSLPEEPRVLGFRPGIWVGAATSYAVCIGMILLEVCAALLLTAWHKQIMSTMSTVIGVMSLLYFSYAISYFYGIPKRSFVFRYVVLPVVLISIVGIIAAIMMGQYRNYENQKAQHNIHSSVVAPAGIAPAARLQNATYPARTTGQTLLATPSRFGDSSLLSSRIRKEDAHCTSGLPLAAPWLPSGMVSATVAGFVSRSQALRYVMENQQNLHGTLDPRYLPNQRVLVHPLGTPDDATELAVVPMGMSVMHGEIVRIASFRASHRMPCAFIPNRVVNNDGVSRSALLASYAESIARRVLANWHGASRLNATVSARIALNPDGEVLGDPVISSPIHNAALDSDIEKAILKAGPFTPPAGLPYHDYRVVIIRFRPHS